jgi:hypothetical protein
MQQPADFLHLNMGVYGSHVIIVVIFTNGDYILLLNGENFRKLGRMNVVEINKSCRSDRKVAKKLKKLIKKRLDVKKPYGVH